MADATLEPPSEEEDESEDCDEEDDEDWVWHSAGANLTKQYHGTLNGQVRLLGPAHPSFSRLQAAEAMFLSSPTGKTGPVRHWCPTRLTKL